MSAKIQGNIRTFEAGETLATGERVKVSAANTVVQADAADLSIGVVASTGVDGGTAGKLVAVQLDGTLAIKHGVGVVAGLAYSGADGTVSTTELGAAEIYAVIAVAGGIAECVKVGNITEAGS
jgi:hypothetical protein